jgi:hypothetical protein
MISIEEGIVYLLKNNAGVSALVGTRVYAQKLPQTPTTPALTYQLITPRSLISHQGMSGTAYPRYQITGWDTTEAGISALMKAVRICMSCYKGTVGAAPNTVVIQASLPVGGYETYEPETGLFMRALDFEIWHAEALS